MVPVMNAYEQAKAALHEALRVGWVDPDALDAFQQSMATLAPVQKKFGQARYDELMALLDQVEQLPNSAVHPSWDKAWVFIFVLMGIGAVYPPVLILAAFIAMVRGLAYLGWRFPLTTAFFVAFFYGLMGWRRRW